MFSWTHWRHKRRRLGRRRAQRPAARQFETLEPRLVLDSTVVFNEVMYNPPGPDDTLEWVELHNQMAVDMDLSQWSIEGGVEFEFPAGTTLPGGGYLVVASDPATLAAATGFGDALGPFRGQLANGGEQLTLRNRNDRVMDAVQFSDDDPWPVGADGSGATLAKIDKDLGSSQPTSWTTSAQLGGTPGENNFPSFDPSRETTTLIAVDESWDYRASTTPPPADWNGIGFDSGGWSAGKGMFAAGSVTIDYAGGPVPPTSEPTGVPLLNAGFEATDIAFGGGGNFYSNIPDWNDPVGGPAGIGSTLNHTSAWLNGLTPPEGNQVAFIQGPGSFRQTVGGLEVGQTYVLSYFENERDVTGTGSTYARTTTTFNGQEIVPVHRVSRTENWHEVRSVPFVATSTSGVIELRNLGGAGDNSALFDAIRLDFIAPPLTPATDLPLGPTTYYFRHELNFDGDPQLAELTFNGIIDDGAVLYLNGTEVTRINMPAGIIAHETRALAAVGDPAFSGAVTIPVDSLRAGRNVLAAEVHQAADDGGDMLFGLELSVSVGQPDPRVPLAPLAINEVGAAEDDTFFVELVNVGDTPVDVAGHLIATSGAPDRPVNIGAQGPLGPGQYLTIDRLALGLTPAAGARVFLYGPGQTTLVDAVRVTDRPRGRQPDGLGRWFVVDALTPGSGNQFSLHDEIVINEVMYHHRLELAPLPIPPPAGALGFDFGPLDAPRADGYVAVGEDPYSATAGYGWTNGSVRAVDRATGGAVHRDMVTVINPGATFAADLPNGVYDVTVLMGDAKNLRDQIQLRFEPGTDREVSDEVTVAAGQYARKTYSVAVRDGQLNLALSDLGGVSTRALINALLISPMPVPLDSTDEQWIELFNRSDHAVDLTGWRMADAVRFDFPAGTLIGPGEYLVVAKDAVALTSKYPDLTGRVVGNFTGNLSNKDDRVQVIDPVGNLADEVHYYDAGRWPAAADGGGSSLELRDPDADNAVAEAWSPSREGTASEWQTYRYSGTAVEPVGANNPRGYQELVLGLLDEGEVLIDDIHVVEDPAGAAIERLQNGSFEGDAVNAAADAWRIIGNHSGQVVTDPDDPSNQVLQLVATGPTEHMHNHAETTFASGATIVTGGQYEISFRAKWISGSNQVNSRLYFNKLPRTTRVDVPTRHGTPGRANSQWEANIGPTYTDFGHLPLVPAPEESVSVFARADDPDGVTAMTLWYSVDGSAMSSTPMVRMADGRYRGTVPEQDAGATVQFYVQGQDGLGAGSMFPAAGPASRALYRVADGPIDRDGVHLLRLIMTEQDSDILHTNANVMSNGRLGGTVIYDDATVFYDVGVHLRASGYGRTGPRAGFNIRFDPQHLFRGVQESIVIDRGVVLTNGDSTGVRGVAGASPHELLFDQIANHAGGIPAMVNDVVYFDAPRAANTGLGALKLARYTSDYLDSQFDNGSEGELYKFELIYYANRTVDGNKESLKTSPNAVTEIDIRDMGDDKEAYRLNYILNSQRARDDFSRIIDLGQTLSLSGDALQQRAEEVMDIDQWMRYVAMISLTGVGDTYLMDLNHNLQLYVRPEDNRVLVMPWDYDFAFFHRFDSPLTGRRNTNLTKLIQRPENLRRVYGHLLDLINTAYNTTYLDPWIANYTDRTGYDDLAPLFHEYVDRRRSYVLEQLATLAPQVPFQITTSGGSDLTVDTKSVTLEGNGWIDVHTLRRAGSDQPLAVTWSDQDSWQVTLPVGTGRNSVELQAYNFQGQLVGSDSIVVTSTAFDPLDEWLKITEINYNPHDALTAFGEMDVENDQFEFLELANISPSDALELAGVTLVDGVEFTFGDTRLAPGERTLVVRNRGAFESRYGTGLNIAGQFGSGKLSNSGETLRLEDTASGTIVELTYGDSSPWPGRADGKGATLELIDPQSDPNVAGNWRSSSEFGGSPGRAGSDPLLDVLVNEVLPRGSGVDTDQVELVNTTAAPIEVAGWYLSDDSGDLLKGSIPAGRSIAAGGYLVLTEAELGFGLNGRQGDDLWLVAADAVTGRPVRFVDHVEFAATDPGMSLGRWPDADSSGRLFPMTQPTFGQTNSGPLAGDVVLSELHYHPDNIVVEPLDSEQFEFVELIAAADHGVDLSGWRIDGGVAYQFADGVTIAPREAVVIVGFDPADEPALAAFRARFGIGQSVVVVGPYTGRLGNGGDDVELVRPTEPGSVTTGFVLVDRVAYGDQPPWPVAADGGGQSLQRVALSAYGDLANSWTAAEPTPGTSPFRGPAGDMNLDGVVDGQDVQAFVLGLSDPATYAATFGVPARLAGDLDGDGGLDFDDIAGFVAIVVSANRGL